MINIIVAHDKNMGIGYQNKLPWYVPQDLERFRKITSGHTVVMGRKTFESIGKALPNRKNIILSRDTSYEAKGCTVMNADDLMAYALNNQAEEIFVIGGEEIYTYFLPYADRLYTTIIYGSYQCDSFFPMPDFEGYITIDLGIISFSNDIIGCYWAGEKPKERNINETIWIK